MIDHGYITKVLVSGHSLGGALASLCALDIQYNILDKCALSIEIVCVTFGCPKVGNKYFVKSFNKRIPNYYNFRNGWDLICVLPPLPWFKKNAKYIYIGKKKWYNCIKDHYPHRYKESFQKRST